MEVIFLHQLLLWVFFIYLFIYLLLLLLLLLILCEGYNRSIIQGARYNNSLGLLDEARFIIINKFLLKLRYL
jgi:hypothetical protein